MVMMMPPGGTLAQPLRCAGGDGARPVQQVVKANVKVHSKPKSLEPGNTTAARRRSAPQVAAALGSGRHASDLQR